MVKVIAVFLINAAGLALATYIPGFEIKNGIAGLAALTLIFTALNLFVKPLLKLILGPVIILTLGIALFFINALMLYLLDFLSENLTIQSTLTLLYATLLV